MVEDPIEDDPDAALVGGIEQRPQRVVTAEERIDREIIGRVVAMVRCRGKDGVQVEPVDPEIDEIVEPLDDPVQVPALEAGMGRRSGPVLERAGRRNPPAPGEAVGKDLVEDRVGDPDWHVDGRVGHRAPQRVREDVTDHRPSTMTTDERGAISATGR